MGERLGVGWVSPSLSLPASPPVCSETWIYSPYLRHVADLHARSISGNHLVP